jgi:hypothetical protein
MPGVLEDVPFATRAGMYIRHDGAPPHVPRVVIQYLNNTFLGRWIGSSGPINWPPRSPDLTPLDCGLWGWIESQFCERKVKNTRDALLARILDAAARIKEHRD